MSREKIIGRIDETGILKDALDSGDPEFIAVYGRRRIGKTFLIREFFDDRICFELTGMNDAPLKEQLKNFSYSLKDAMGLGIMPQVPASWFEAFSFLEQFLDSPGLKQRKGKRVVFIDELPWFNTPKSGFLSALEHFWNSYGSKHSNLILVVSGSAASWMIQRIVQSRGGLHNRLTRQIRLLPFSLLETEQYLQSRGILLSRYQIVCLYMAMGGVPFYLKHAEPGLSSAQIIDKTCFSKDGVLRNEFEKLFISLFDQSELHSRIVEVLRKKRSGLTRNLLLAASEIPSGGTATTILKELEESGFISSSVPFGKKSNDAIFRISDEFLLFYFDWIKPLGKRDAGDGYWMSFQNDPKRRAWSGLAFEGICMKHIRQIKDALGIRMVETFHGPWYYYPKNTDSQQGAQIDLLIDRKDGIINLCEMKFSESEFTVDADYSGKLRRKADVFRSATKTKKTIFITMITTFGLTGSPASRDVISNELTMECLF